MFLEGEVFNISVDKLVEKRAFSQANYTFLSTLIRFALFQCNTPAFAGFPKSSREKSPAVSTLHS
jgi:hypothetical protein